DRTASVGDHPHGWEEVELGLFRGELKAVAFGSPMKVNAAQIKKGRRSVDCIERSAFRPWSNVPPDGERKGAGILQADVVRPLLLLIPTHFGKDTTPSRTRIFFDAPIQACYYAALSCLING